MRFRVPLILVLGLPLSFLLAWVILRMEQPGNDAAPTGLAISYPIVTAFLLIIGLNRAAARLFGRENALSQAELLALYSLMGIGCAYVCWENLGIIVPALAFPAALPFRGEAGTEWMGEITRRLPAWAIVHNQDAALALLKGGAWSDLWRGWVAPLTGWGLLLGALFVASQGLMRLFYDPWAHGERLSFPLTYLPLELSNARTTLFQSRLFWISFLGAASLDLWNGLATFYPSLPMVNVKVQWLSLNDASPGINALGGVPYTMHPLMIGLAFLLPTDLLFSTWFFYLVTRVELYVAGTFGVAKGVPYMFADNVPGIQAQCAGAMVTLGAGWLWAARGNIRRRWLAAQNGDAGARRDFALLALGGAIMGLWLIGVGLPLWAALLVLAYMILIALFVTRLRAELGLPVHNLAFLGADGPINALFGGEPLGKSGMVGLASLYSLMRSSQGHPMPHLMEATYLAEKSQREETGTLGVPKSFLTVLLIAGIVFSLGMPYLFLATLSVHGLEGGTHGYHRMGMEGWNLLNGQLSRTPPPNLASIVEMAVGAGVVFGLTALRQFWFNSPFNPIGYAISGSWHTMMIALPLFIAWVIKSLLLRYGGLKCTGTRFRWLLASSSASSLLECSGKSSPCSPISNPTESGCFRRSYGRKRCGFDKGNNGDYP